nr:oligoendopeptidase F [Tissierella sp.]
MIKEALERKDLKKEDTWDLEAMFENFEAWEKEYKEVKDLSLKIEDHKENFTNSAQELLSALKDRDEILRRGENVIVYAHMRLDEDTRETDSQSLNDRAQNLWVEVMDKLSFFLPGVLSLDETKLMKFIKENKELSLYRKFLDDILRQREHLLSPREESILAKMGEVGNSPQKTFSMLNNADLKFPTIKDETGKDIEITHGNFIPLMESTDREVRKNAFKALYKTYKGFENTFASTLNGDLKNNIFNANMREYSSTREASLSENNIDLSVYDNLIEAIHENLDSMHKYMDIRKRALGVDELHMYDLYTPMVKDVDFNFEYDDGVELIQEALKPLNEEYLSAMDKGFNDRWIDIYENKGKRSGAYSSGSYDSKPYILLNYHETLDNVFTVAHEMGHSMHSFFTKNNQPFIYGNYSIFVAEVASTCNESLLIQHMLKNEKDKNKKLYLLNHYLESFRGTVFRQTMFCEFEKIINEYLEGGGALTAEYLSDTYKELNRVYYGDSVVIDDEIAIEWARIPHFYYNFYVFQYATGFSAAVSLSQKILEEGDGAVEKYLDFLKSGSSDYPIEVLKKAGVDMTTKEPVNNAMKLFKELVDEIDKLI